MKLFRTTCFSLIEFLVVVAILAVLASLLTPSFDKIKSRSEKTHCRTNMMQLASLFSVYTEDYDGRFPYGIPHIDMTNNQIPTDSLSPQELIYDYTSGHKEVYVCPSDESPEDYWWWRYRGHPNGVTASSYMFCENGLYGSVFPSRLGEPITVYNIKSPRTYIYMTDGRCCPNGWTWRHIDPEIGTRLDWDHDEYVNMLHGDFHVEEKWLYDDVANMRRRPDIL